MERIAERVARCLKSGCIEGGLDQIIDFHLYLTAKKIMQLKKEDRASYLKKIPSCFHDRIREHAVITIRYFSTSKKGVNINTSTNNGDKK